MSGIQLPQKHREEGNKFDFSYIQNHSLNFSQLLDKLTRLWKRCASGHVTLPDNTFWRKGAYQTDVPSDAEEFLPVTQRNFKFSSISSKKRTSSDCKSDSNIQALNLHRPIKMLTPLLKTVPLCATRMKMTPVCEAESGGRVGLSLDRDRPIHNAPRLRCFKNSLYLVRMLQ